MAGMLGQESTMVMFSLVYIVYGLFEKLLEKST